MRKVVKFILLIVFVFIFVDCGKSEHEYSKSKMVAESLSDKAVDILAKKCSQCHGPQSAGSGGINFITDVDALIENEIITPGSPDTSLLIDVLESGRMPLVGSMSKSEIGLLRQWLMTALNEDLEVMQ